MELHPPHPQWSHRGPRATRGPTATRADAGGTMPRFLQSPPVWALLTSRTGTDHTTAALPHPHGKRPMGCLGDAPSQPFLLNGKGLSRGPCVVLWGGPSWSRRLFDPPRAAGRLHGAAGRSASPGGLEVRGPHPGLGGPGGKAECAFLAGATALGTQAGGAGIPALKGRPGASGQHKTRT